MPSGSTYGPGMMDITGGGSDDDDDDDDKIIMTVYVWV